MTSRYDQWRMTDEEVPLNCEYEPVISTDFEDFTNQTPSEVIIEAVAAAAGVDPLELPSLYNYVDPDAVDTLVSGRGGAAEPTLKFKMRTWDILIRGDGKICVCDRSRPIDPQPVFGKNSV